MNVSLIFGFNPGAYVGDGNNTYLIGGHEPTLIAFAEDAKIDPARVVAARQALAGPGESTE